MVYTLNDDTYLTDILQIKKRDMSVCLSGYTFHSTLISHAEILDSNRGHIFRKYRRKNNKKVSLIYEKTVKNRPLPGYLPPVAMHRIAYVSKVWCVYVTIAFCVLGILTQKFCVQTAGCRKVVDPE